MAVARLSATLREHNFTGGSHVSSFNKSDAAALVLAFTLSACATPPANLDLSLEKRSVAGRYVVALAPPPVAPAINQMHSWTVRLTDIGGGPITGAKLAVGGGMPQHGHGLPTT
ncbi:MAG: hypothetical protein ABIQ86_09715 [Steroidobacteraceae bacterium]